MARPSARDRILHAAARLAARRGAAALTLDAAAREARVSKGGLLYHFATKEALLLALVEDAAAAFEAEVERRAARDPVAIGRFARAFVAASFPARGRPAFAELGEALLAAVTADRRLLAPLEARYARWLARAADDGLDPAVADVVLAAVDGLWSRAVFGLGALPPRRAAAVVRELARMTAAPGRA